MREFREQQAQREEWEQQGEENQKKLELRSNMSEYVLKHSKGKEITKKKVSELILKINENFTEEFIEDIYNLVSAVRGTRQDDQAEEYYKVFDNSIEEWEIYLTGGTAFGDELIMSFETEDEADEWLADLGMEA